MGVRLVAWGWCILLLWLILTQLESRVPFFQRKKDSIRIASVAKKIRHPLAGSFQREPPEIPSWANRTSMAGRGKSLVLVTQLMNKGVQLILEDTDHSFAGLPLGRFQIEGHVVMFILQSHPAQFRCEVRVMFSAPKAIQQNSGCVWLL